MTGHRYPLEPLATALHIELHHTGGHQPGDPPTGLLALATWAGVTHRRARQWAQHGLTDITADRLATRAGRHPAQLWPTWFTDTDGDHDWYPDDPDINHLDTPALAGCA